LIATYTPHATFYRVVSVNEFVDGVPGTPGQRTLAQYEVQQPLRGFTDSTGNVPVFPIYTPPNNAGPPATWNLNQNPGIPITSAGGTLLGYPGTSVVFDGVARVFEMGVGRIK
jgi:hypothetical protein